MATEGGPADLVKVLHLLFISFTWGMQVWVSFIAGLVLLSKVSLHTFGLVQSKLFPMYFYCLLASNTVSLVIYTVYHPRKLLDGHETIQMALFFMAVIMSGLNVQWFTPAVLKHSLVMRKIEQEHGLGGEIRFFTTREPYKKLCEQDPKYKAHRKTFYRYHGMSILTNITGFACTTVILIYLALHLATI
ncbi:transmembrane protein 205-like [Clarias gariepinus]|uniref:transmembrane protein 205-like n=1 Tax=Clarias gariepinus TaxID=13013 RepID=UPI00234D6D5E|nr:transmembrane protein 205-like [Clarias gariepinus]